MTPVAFGPKQIPRVTEASSGFSPTLSVLSTIMHGNKRGGREVITAMDALLGTIDEESAARYAGYAAGLLKPHARNFLEALMKTESQAYHSEYTRQYFAQGLEQGRLEAEQETLIRLADKRGFRLSEDQLRKISECDDSKQLETWLDRLFVVKSAGELFR